MELNPLVVFAVAAFFETLQPGPTIALVFETRASAGKVAALKTVAGITVANIFWVILALLVLHSNATWFGDKVSPGIGFFGVFYLMYLASERLLASAVQFIANENEQVPTKTRKYSFFSAGFWAHAGNPLSVSFYLATFSLLVTGKSTDQALIYGSIPIVVDMVIFTLLASLYMPITKDHFPKGLIQLLAGLSLFYLVAHVSSNAQLSVAIAHEPSTTPVSSVLFSPLMALTMLASFLLASISVANRFVQSRKGKENKSLWRVVSLWDSWFKVAALFGAIFALIGLFGPSSFQIDSAVDHRIRICFVVAAALAVTLSLAKSYGELQDGKFPGEVSGSAIDVNCWQASIWWVGVAALAILIIAFLLMTATGFRVLA